MSIDYLFVYSILTGIFLCSSLSCIGCVALWKNSSFLGEAISHASLIGVLLSFILSFDITVGLIIYATVFGVIIYFMRNIKFTNVSSLIVSYTLLSVGIVFLGLYKRINFDLMSLLFGDVLLISRVDLVVSASIFLSVVGWLYKRWKQILCCSLNEEMAFVLGYKPDQINFEFCVIISLIVALSIKIIGVLMVTAMLIIPAAASAGVSNSPSGMVIRSGIISILSLVFGLMLSYHLDTITGPTIVLVSSIIFLILWFYRLCKR